MPKSPNSSKSMVSLDNQGTETTHIIPLGDDKQSAHEISPNKRVLIVDKLDILNELKIIQCQSAIPPHSLHIVQEEEDSTMHNLEASTLVHREETNWH